MAKILPASWPEILANVEKALAHANENAARLASEPAESPPTESESALEATLERLRAHQADGIAGASEKAAEAEALLTLSEEALRGWLAKVGTLRRKLATPAEHSL
jgi:hypothetical protein